MLTLSLYIMTLTEQAMNHSHINGLAQVLNDDHQVTSTLHHPPSTNERGEKYSQI